MWIIFIYYIVKRFKKYLWTPVDNKMFRIAHAVPSV